MTEIADLESRIDGVVRSHEMLGRYTTIRIGGPASIWVQPENPSGVESAVQWADEYQIPVTILGNGSNSLIADSGVNGMVLKTQPGLTQIDFDGVRVHLGAGVPLGKVVYLTAQKGLRGMERLAGIPGTVGGAVRMNAGTQRGTVADIIEGAAVLTRDGSRAYLPADELGFTYRGSAVADQDLVVLSATFQLEADDPLQIQDRLREYDRYREQTQPVGQLTLGSTFKNPEGASSAGYLLEQAGLKGLARGDAAVSRIHTNFIINRGQARASDVLWLMKAMQSRVYDQFAVRLQPEVRFIGNWQSERKYGLPQGQV